MAKSKQQRLQNSLQTFVWEEYDSVLHTWVEVEGQLWCWESGEWAKTPRRRKAWVTPTSDTPNNDDLLVLLQGGEFDGKANNKVYSWTPVGAYRRKAA